MNPRTQRRITAAISRASRRRGKQVKVLLKGEWKAFDAAFLGESELAEEGRVGSVGSRGMFLFSYEDYERLVELLEDEEAVRLVDGSTEWEVDLSGFLAKESEGVIAVSAYRITKGRQ